MSKIKDFEEQWMGRRVRYTQRLVRSERRDPVRRHCIVKRWSTVEDAGLGWVVGGRGLQNGVSAHIDYEAGWAWEQTAPPTPAVMVATGAAKRPIMVPIESLTLVDGGEQ